METKRILAVHDLSCHGAASLGIVLPVLTAFGYRVVALPSVILSSTTDLDEDPVALATTAWMEKVIARWRAQHLTFNAVYTGWLGDPKQVALLRPLCDHSRSHGATIFIDPVLGDCGVVYPCQKDLVGGMRTLAQSAHVITPNPTEAALLLGKQPTDFGITEDGTVTEDEARVLAEELAAFNPHAVSVIKSVTAGNRIGVCIRFTPENTAGVRAATTEFILGPRAATAPMGGTGDLFASLLVGLWMQQMPREKRERAAIIRSVVHTVSRIMKTVQRDKGVLPFRRLLYIKDKV